jgi:acyl-coenzyme A synthetase/AMP-(fatty) acid ligase
MVRYVEAGGLPPLTGNCRVALAGAPISDALRDRFETLSGCRLTDIYGSTEAGGIAYRHDAGPWHVEPHVAIRIDEQGFLEVRSPSVSIGAKDAFYRVGDVVRPEGDGFVLLGRQDDVVKIGGRRTALGEIQEVIEQMPGVARAAVLAQEVRGKLRIAAYVQPENRDFHADSVKSYVRSQLADHKVPRVVYLLDQLPLTTGGKIAKAKLAALVQGKN